METDNQSSMLNVEEMDGGAIQEKQFQVSSDKDVVKIREYAREIAGYIGFTNNDQTLIATAVSEICRNIIEYAKYGEISISPSLINSKKGILIIAKDDGPGIHNLTMALKDGYSSGRGMGVGLPGTRRIMDKFNIDSKPGRGTKIEMQKWISQ